MKIPPQNTEIESLLLGELIQFPDIIDDVIAILNPADFYQGANAKIFQVIYDLWSEGKKIDLAILTNRLSKIGILEELGGIYGITMLIEKVMTSSAVVEHAMIIKDSSVKRQFIEYAAKIGNTAFDNSGDIDELISISNGGLDRITDNIFKTGSSESFKSIIDGTINEYFERKQKASKGDYTGIRTPLHDLNNITGGWQPGDLIIIAGRPSMGKTAFAVQCGVTASRLGYNVDIYTLEMTSRQFTQRILSCVGDLDIEKFRIGKLDEKQEEGLEQLVNRLLELQITLDDKTGITAEYIKARSSANKRRKGCDMIIIDYLQLMSFDEKLNSNEGYGSITRKLKGLAKELDIPVILLSQLNRQLEQRGNKRPMLADLRSSGEIEQDADLVIFPFRPHYYSGQPADMGRLEVIVAKYRHGRTGNIDAFYNESITKFYDEQVNGQNEIPY